LAGRHSARGRQFGYRFDYGSVPFAETLYKPGNPCYDADSAGERATQRGMLLLRKAGLQVLIAQVPGDKDPDDYVRHNGGEAFQQVLQAALPMYQYFMQQLKKKFDLQTVEGKGAYVREFASVLSESDSPVEIDGYVRELARQLQITEQAIYREMKSAVETI